MWRRITPVALILAIGMAMFSLLPGKRRTGQNDARLYSSESATAAEISPWQLAALKVVEDRGEQTGRQAKVEVPDQLRHYSDTRRFLAIQVAEWKEHDVATPHDFADLARMIRSGKMVEVASVGENHVLYGVGALADKDLFTHYDEASGKRIPLLGEAEIAQEHARVDDSATLLDEEISALKQELNSLGKAERAARASLQARLTSQGKALKALHERRELLEAYAGDSESRQELIAEHGMIAGLASDLSGHAYDLTDSAARKELKVRMLSHLRPEALSVLDEIARSYRQKFDRPLPVTSLIRPDEYQRQLSKVNSNATRIQTPPHSTGLAFDIFYRYMTADEQAHVMSDLARLRDEGRIEALRENRDHFHVFAFVDGKRPVEELIRASLGEATGSSRQPKESKPAQASQTKASQIKALQIKAPQAKASQKKSAQVAQRKAAKKGARKKAV
ncbi:MAG TPA: DUF5715 family protein [Pyrinomonadaceae bacterium]|nr:DUF5715 family protein [Pyrinomonadaceae bacterium]